MCGISSALDVLGDKWSLLVVRDMALKGKRSFGEFRESEERIATNILSERLDRLEAQGIIAKDAMPNGRGRSYALTEKGKDLIPVLIELVAWSDKHMEITERGRDLAKSAREDRAALVARLRARLEAGGGPTTASEV